MIKFNSKKIAVWFVALGLTMIFPILISFADPGCDGTTINNPLGCDNNSVIAILQKIMNLVALVGGIIVVFFIIYSGYKFVMAQGKPDEITKAKDMFLATIIGGAILLGADVIANVVVNTINDTTGRTP